MTTAPKPVANVPARAVTLTPANAATVIKRYGGVEVRPASSALSEDRGLVMGIYGPGSIGKTTLAATVTDSPIGSPAYYMDARGNPHVISSYGDRVQVAQITRFEQVAKIYDDVRNDRSFPFKSVIIDNVTELWSMDLRDRYGPHTIVDWTKHSASTSDIIQLIRNWTDLALSGPKINVVFVFQETPEKRDIRGQKDVTRSEINANKALQSDVPSLVHFMGRLWQVNDQPPYRRCLDFRPIETMQTCKLQVDPQDEFHRTIPFQIYDPSLAPILDTLRGRKPFPVERHAERPPK